MKRKQSIGIMVFGVVLAGAVLTSCSSKFGVPSAPIPHIPMTDTFTSTISPTSTLTAAYTATVSKTPTAVFTAAPSASPTPTNTAMSTPTGTTTYTPLATLTLTATPTATNTFTTTATSIATTLGTAPSLNLTSGVTTLTTGVYYFSCVNIGTGAVVTISGAVTIFTECFTLNAGATITGVGMGYAPNSPCGIPPWLMGGPGTGSTSDCVGPLSASGGGHGGAGQGTTYISSGITCLTPGGLANDNPVHPQYMGSAGGYPGDFLSCPVSQMDYGGGLLDVVVYNPVSNTLQAAIINGTIDMSGSNTVDVGMDGDQGGGGAGGTILLEANAITGTGNLFANGESGYADALGGGGIISLIESATSFPGTLSVTGANPGIVTFTAAPTSGY